MYPFSCREIQEIHEKEREDVDTIVDKKKWDKALLWQRLTSHA